MFDSVVWRWVLRYVSRSRVEGHVLSNISNASSTFLREASYEQRIIQVFDYFSPQIWLRHLQRRTLFAQNGCATTVEMLFGSPAVVLPRIRILHTWCSDFMLCISEVPLVFCLYQWACLGVPSHDALVDAVVFYAVLGRIEHQVVSR